MHLACKLICASLLLGLLPACSPSAPVDSTAASAPSTATVNDAPAAPNAAPAPRAAPPSAVDGTATVDLQAEGVAVAGDYPASICAGPYLMGEGLAYQTTADGWQITVAVEGARRAGTITLRPGDDAIGVVATVNGPGRQFVRKRSLGGTFEVSDDFKHAEADLELGEVVGRGTARLKVVFVCA